jgi:uncharacterized membrane protein (DUF373 family)
MTIIDVSELTDISVQQDEPIVARKSGAEHSFANRGRALIESLDDLIYVLTAAVFVLAAAAMLGYSVYGFARHAHAGFAPAVVALINDLLLVMIMMEVLKTILSYLEDHAISLRPFLFIGIISATRRILTVGAGLAIASNPTRAELWNNLDDLLVNAAIILALAIAIRLVGQPAQDFVN